MRPILWTRDQSCFDRIIVHIFQLLSCFSLRIHVEPIVLRLSHRTLEVRRFRLNQQTIPVQPFQLDRGASFPLIDEGTQSILFTEPHQGMNVFRHHHKTKTTPLLVNQLHAKEVDDDALGLDVIQRSSTFVTGESHEIGMPSPSKMLRRIRPVLSPPLKPDHPSCPTGTGNELPVPPCDYAFSAVDFDCLPEETPFFISVPCALFLAE